MHLKALTVLIASVLLLSFSASAHQGLQDQIDAVNRQLVETPGSPDALQHRGFLLRSQGNNRQALADYDALISLAPKRADYRLERAKTLVLAGLPGKACQDLDWVIEQKQLLDRAYYQRARLYEGQGILEKARADYVQAIRFAQDQSFYLRYAGVLDRLKLPERAEVVAGEGLKRYPRSYDLTQAWIALKIQLNDLDGCRKRLDRQLETHRFDTPWLLLMARVEHAAGQLQQATSRRQQALNECIDRCRFGKANAIHQTWLATTLYELKRPKAAERIVRGVLAAQPEYPRAQELLKKLLKGRSKGNG
jgi:tetratricopeptide (TPR) repeat protein